MELVSFLSLPFDVSRSDESPGRTPHKVKGDERSWEMGDDAELAIFLSVPFDVSRSFEPPSRTPTQAKAAASGLWRSATMQRWPLVTIEHAGYASGLGHNRLQCVTIFAVPRAFSLLR